MTSYTVVGLLSGGKDSCYNLVECARRGHHIVALANLEPFPLGGNNNNDNDDDELDSQCFQTVGTGLVPAIAKCLELPLIRRKTRGEAIKTSVEYIHDNDNDDLSSNGKEEVDEVEDLYWLLHEVLEMYPNVNAVSCGAILSNYQRCRVENVCERLGLVPLAFLWQREQHSLLDDMVQDGMQSIVVKIASMGLKVSFLGKTLEELQSQLVDLHERFELNVCGEGGEYETLTLDAPIFRKKIIIEEQSIRKQENMDPFAPVAHLQINRFTLQDKSEEELLPHRVLLSRISPVAEGHSSNVETKRSTAAVRSVGLPQADINSDTRPLDHGRFSRLGPFYASRDVEGASEKMKEVFVQMREELSTKGMNLQNICFVNLYLTSMDDFRAINDVYVREFPSYCPPSRACIAVSNNFAAREPLSADIICTTHGERSVLHVKSISSWAPVSIGPYAQVNDLHGVFMVAGTIGLIPDSMLLPSGSIEKEVQQAWRNLKRILYVKGSKLSKSIQCLVYISQSRVRNLNDTSVKEISEIVKEQLSRVEDDDKFPPPGDEGVPPVFPLSSQVIAVEQLPRNALVEFECISLESTAAVSVQSVETWLNSLHVAAHLTTGPQFGAVSFVISAKSSDSVDMVTEDTICDALSQFLSSRFSSYLDEWTSWGLTKIFLDERLYNTLSSAPCFGKMLSDTMPDRRASFPVTFEDDGTFAKIHILLQRPPGFE